MVCSGGVVSFHSRAGPNIVKVLMILWMKGDSVAYKYDLVELFSGKGRAAAQYDQTQSRDQDFHTRSGFATLVLNSWCLENPSTPMPRRKSQAQNS